MAALSFSLPPCRVERDVELAGRCYYGIGGRARFFASPDSPAELAGLLAWNRGLAVPLPVALLGEGSNTLFSDREFPGIVVRLGAMQRMFWYDASVLFCEAGVTNTAVAEALLVAGKQGGEWLFRLPGQIGASVRMNARCFGGELSMVTVGVMTVTAEGLMRWYRGEEFFLGYKQTVLMNRAEVVVGVLLSFPDGADRLVIGEGMARCEAERLGRHHFDFPSCGSTFKNNYEAGRSSGQIFDALGFRGAREGGAAVSGHHANFIFNWDGATASDVLRLAGRMRGAALEQLGLALELEVECVGCFEMAVLERCGVRAVRDVDNPELAWSGLFDQGGLWNESRGEQESAIPRLLIEGVLLPCGGKDARFPAGVMVRVEQLVTMAEAMLQPDRPFLRWTTFVGENHPLFAKVPPGAGALFLDGLWEYGVSELFLSGGDPVASPAADPGSESVGGQAVDRFDWRYLEFEMSRCGHWLALAFEGVRRRAAGIALPDDMVRDGAVSLFRTPMAFGMELSWKLVAPLVGADGTVGVQCCGSTGGGEYGLFPWWSDPLAPADFHQPERYFRVVLQ